MSTGEGYGNAGRLDPAPPPLVDPDAHEGALKRGARTRLLRRRRRPGRERLLRALPRLLRALDVDVLDLLGGDEGPPR